MKVVIIQENGRAIARFGEQEDGKWKDMMPSNKDGLVDEPYPTDELIDELVAVLM